MSGLAHVIHIDGMCYTCGRSSDEIAKLPNVEQFICDATIGKMPPGWRYEQAKAEMAAKMEEQADIPIIR